MSWPGIAGTWGRLSWPTAEITARATSVSSVPSTARTRTSHVASLSFQVAASTSVSKRTWRSIPCLRITPSKYAWSSGCWAKYSVHWSLGSKL